MDCKKCAHDECFNMLFPKQVFFAICLIALLLSGCAQTPPGTVGNTNVNAGGNATAEEKATVPAAVPHQGEWGIYSLDLASNDVELVYGSSDEIQTSALRLNAAGDRLAFAQKVGGDANENLEIYTVGTNGSNPQRLTDNGYWDLYPAWSPDGTRIAFLSKRDKDLDIYVMDANGSDARKLYDSGTNDADIDWADGRMAFTSNNSIWTIEDDGTEPARVTNPKNAGLWGTANLPIGDYDPRLSSDGKKIVFERLEDVNATHGGYNLFAINADGTGETRLTDDSYAQGLASWSHSSDKIVYVVAAIGNEGKYDLYMMNADGTTNRDITPDYFPPDFLCHSPVFSKDDSKIYFIGQWWE